MNASQSYDITVVVACLNALPALQETVTGTLAFGDPRIRLVIVDGASVDGTREYLQTLPMDKVSWISERDCGIYDAMNKGWNMAPESAYVLYLGAGDKIVSMPGPRVMQSGFDSGERVVIGVCHIGDQRFDSSWTAALRLSNTAHHQALLIHKSVCPLSPFDESMRVYGDWDFNLRLFKRGVRATLDGGFATYAKPGGVSSRHDLLEIWRVAYRHGGLKMAILSFLKNARAELRLVRNAWRQSRARCSGVAS